MVVSQLLDGQMRYYALHCYEVPYYKTPYYKTLYRSAGARNNNHKNSTVPTTPNTVATGTSKG